MQDDIPSGLWILEGLCGLFFVQFYVSEDRVCAAGPFQCDRNAQLQPVLRLHQKGSIFF